MNLWKLAMTVLAAVAVMSGVVSRAEAVIFDPIIFDKPLDYELRLEPFQPLAPTGGTLFIGTAGTLLNSGIIQGNLEIQQGGTLKLDLSEPDVLEVQGSVLIGSGASLVALGIVPRPGPGPIGDDWLQYLDLGHEYYVASNGTFVGFDGRNALGVVPRPPRPPIGDESFGLSAISITMGDGSFLNFDFDFAAANYGDSFIFGNSGFSLADGATINTNLPDGWVMMNSLPIVFNLNGAPVPEPSTFVLLGAGLAGLAGMGYRRKRANK